MALQKPSKLFYVYAEQDKALVSELDNHLITLKRQGIIESWHRGMLKAGEAVDAEIEKPLNEADIILLMLSVDFLNSVHVYEVQMVRAMERRQDGTAIVIPIMLRAADYQGELFGALKAQPKDSKPISGRSLSERDVIWTQISKFIKDEFVDGETDVEPYTSDWRDDLETVLKTPEARKREEEAAEGAEREEIQQHLVSAFRTVTRALEFVSRELTGKVIASPILLFKDTETTLICESHSLGAIYIRSDLKIEITVNRQIADIILFNRLNGYLVLQKVQDKYLDVDSYIGKRIKDFASKVIRR